MSDSLQAYYADIREIEDRFYTEHVERHGGLVYGYSEWGRNLDLLRQVQQRHGLATDDPRVTSVASFLAEQAQIQSEWERLCGDHRDDPDWHDWQSPEFAAAEWRQNGRLADCIARHFPGLNSLRPETIDSIPKLWAHITQHLCHVRDMLECH
jgi:hypothetical protein